jgi:hypothetical protein
MVGGYKSRILEWAMVKKKMMDEKRKDGSLGTATDSLDQTRSGDRFWPEKGRCMVLP